MASKAKRARASEPKPQPRTVLLTNLNYVVVNGVRQHCYALLLEADSPGFFGTQHKIRGFLSDGALETFDVFLEHNPFPYELIPAESRDAIFISGDGVARPLSSGYIMKLPGGMELQLMVMDQKQPLDEFESTDYDLLWEKLRRKVARYWYAPAMPVAQFIDAERVRSVIPDRG